MTLTYSVVVPCFNEEESIRGVVSRIRDVMEKTGESYEIIVVDDGSTDGTHDILSEIGDITVIRHDKNRGYGAALKTGIKDSRGKYIIITDADGTYPFESVPEMMKYVSEYHMVVGSRNSEIVEDPLLRRVAKFILKQFAYFLSGEHIPDLNSGLRIFHRDLFLRFEHMFPDGFSFTTTITMACVANGIPIKYVPINYFRRRGKSTINPVRDFTGFMMIILRTVLYFKPLDIFLPVSIFFILVGGIKLAIDFAGQNHFGLGGALLVLSLIHI
mgnify:CR=1 FL=1